MPYPTFPFTSESVTEGHPDKIADQISDAILDACLSKDPFSRVACETLISSSGIVIAGEITSHAQVDYAFIANDVLRSIGYGYTLPVTTAIVTQSPDIALGVDNGGAGDQGMMFGYATNETPELMPMPIALAHRLTRRLADVRKSRLMPYLKPDGKAQVTVQYDQAGRPQYVSTVVLSAQHSADVSIEQLRSDLQRHVIEHELPPSLLTEQTRYFINPTGRFVLGGPEADTGLTGRKIIVDTYGGKAHHGGGAFSGKDPTKVDRSAAYMARYIAKNIVHDGLADRCEIQLAYAIGVAEPVSILVDTFGTGIVRDDRLADVIPEVFDLTPEGIIESLSLRQPIYQQTAAYGHFGRPGDAGFTWEQTNISLGLLRHLELVVCF